MQLDQGHLQDESDVDNRALLDSMAFAGPLTLKRTAGHLPLLALILKAILICAIHV